MSRISRKRDRDLDTGSGSSRDDESALVARTVHALPPRVRVLGTAVTACAFSEALGALDALVRSGGGEYVSCANVYSVTMARDDPGYHALLERAAMVTADGMPLVWVLRALGERGVERVHNDDLFLACCERFSRWRHFLVGGREGQPETVAAAMRRRFPGIEVAGTFATPVRPLPDVDNERLIEAIRETAPSIVWVGMGTPAQDHWMAAAAPRLGVPMVGVGSLFDLLSGRTRAAPRWMKRSGLQWLFRLCQEPRRLAGRYVYYNSRFLLAISRELLTRRFRP